MRRIIVLIFIPLYLLLFIPYMLLCYVVKPFNPQLTRHMAYLFTRSYALCLLWLMGAKLLITGQEHIEKNQNYLFVSNHVGLLDSPAMMVVVKQPLSFISKREMKKAPLLANWMYLLQCLFLNRKNPRDGLKTILQGIEQMKQGNHLIVFPQGTRSKNGDFLPFKAGSLKLATKSDKPIIPIAISGTDDVFEKNKLNCKPGNVYIHLFPPVVTKGLTLQAQKSLKDDIQTLIHNKVIELDALPR